VSRIKKDAAKETEIIDRIDCIGRNMAALRVDIPALVRQAVLDILKERRRRPKVEVGYR
jgi:hypothetical protein